MQVGGTPPRDEGGLALVPVVFRLGVWGYGLPALGGLGFRLRGLQVQGLGLGASGLGFGVQGLGAGTQSKPMLKKS